MILIPLIPPPFYQNENHHLKSQLGLLGHELNDRDMSIDQMRAALIRSRDDVLKNSLPDEKLFLSNRKFLVSISTILQDLNKNTKIDGAASGDTNQNQLYKNENLQEILTDSTADLTDPIIINKFTKIILERLSSGIQRVHLAEKMQQKAEEDKNDLKIKVKDLLTKISREKKLKIEKEHQINEKNFQDTISVLQKELSFARKQMRREAADEI